MVNKGFNIAETLRTFGAKLEIPSFTKGQSQLWPEEVKETRTIVQNMSKIKLFSKTYRPLLFYNLEKIFSLKCA